MENFSANNPDNVVDLYDAMEKERHYYARVLFSDRELRDFQVFCSENEQLIIEMIEKKASSDERLLHLEIELKYARWWQRSRIRAEIETLEKFKFYQELDSKFSKHSAQKSRKNRGDIVRERRLEELSKFKNENPACQCRCKCL